MIEGEEKDGVTVRSGHTMVDLLDLFIMVL